jgi:hypothetical protein
MCAECELQYNSTITDTETAQLAMCAECELQYNSTITDAEAAQLSARSSMCAECELQLAGLRELANDLHGECKELLQHETTVVCLMLNLQALSTQFTCFTSTRTLLVEKHKYTDI